jgi:hypothetical protein
MIDLDRYIYTLVAKHKNIFKLNFTLIFQNSAKKYKIPGCLKIRKFYQLFAQGLIYILMLQKIGSFLET